MKNLIEEVSLAYDDITLIPAYSELKSRSLTDPSMHGFSLPIIASCMDTLGNPKMMKMFVDKKILYIAHRAFKSAEDQFTHFCIDENNTLTYEYTTDYLYFAVGSVQKYKDWIDNLYNKGVKNFCVDMAHGDSKACIDTIKYIKNLNKDNKVIAGNVATGEGFRRLEEAGADGIRCGIASRKHLFSRPSKSNNNFR